MKKAESRKVKKTKSKKTSAKRRKRKKTICISIRITRGKGSTSCPAGYKDFFSGDFIQVFLNEKEVCHRALICKLFPCKNK